MNISEAQNEVARQLRTLYDKSESAAIAKLVLEDCTSFTSQELLRDKAQTLSNQQQEKLMNCLHRLLRHEPVQYVMQKAWFYGLELYVDKTVLIPRPETEELVDRVVNDVKASGNDAFQKSATEADATTQLKMLDIGTGSGCIALAIKKALPKAEVWGCDVSEEALNVARRNGSALDIRVDFQGVDFLDEAQQKLLPTVDIIVSNPPYIPLHQKETMDANVVQHEPHIALFVPDDDALLFYKATVQFAKKRLYPNGVIYLEVHENLGKNVVTLFEQEGYSVELRKDMQGKERIVRAKHPASPNPSRREAGSLNPARGK